MKRLLILWDPDNPSVRAADLVATLKDRTELFELTFRDVSHRTLPNRAFDLKPVVERLRPDATLWVEGGPFPADWAELGTLKACWIVNAHEEPTLLSEFAPHFDRVFVSTLKDATPEGFRWLPLSAGRGPAPSPPRGLSVLLEDPASPSHVALGQALERAAGDLPAQEAPVVFCPGRGGRVHPLFFDALRSGATVVTSPDIDLRGIAHVGEHLDVFPSVEGLPDFAKALLGDPERLKKLAERGQAIVSHLHTAELRAGQLLEGLWPSAKVYGRRSEKPLVSVLVTCYRYLKRFRRCLESLARQELRSGLLEVVVADPESPDGLGEYLREFSKGGAHLRIVHLPVDGRYFRNRGAAISRAFDASAGEVIVSIDGDIIFPPHLIAALSERVLRAPDRVYGIRRAFLDRERTEGILGGALDPLADFDRLSRAEGDGEERGYVGVLGYCQAVKREAFRAARYPEEFDSVNQSDIVFVERLAAYAGVRPEFLGEEAVLHLWHPRNWMGTTELL